MSDEEKAYLLKHPLRELEADKLSSYAADSFLTIGSTNDFKYFLPRILELSVREEFLWPDPEVVFGKLQLAHWEQWPEDERAAILELIKDKFDALLQGTETDSSKLDEWICALGHCVPDITPYLNQLFEGTHKDKLWGFVEWNLSAFTEGKLDNSFWKDVSLNKQRVLDWLNQDKIKTLLSERYGMKF